MTPRAAGVIAIGCAVLITVAGGVLLATPPWSIPGALLLVGATILFSIGTVWLYRRSWSDPWPPDVTPSLQKRLRRVRVLVVINGAIVALGLAGAVYALVSQEWWRLLSIAVLLLLGLTNIVVNRRAVRFLREQQEH